MWYFTATKTTIYIIMIDLIANTMSMDDRRQWIDDILNRLCSLYGVANKKDLHKHFNFGARAPSQWKATGRIPEDWLNAAVVDLNKKGKAVSLDWLLYGVTVSQINTDDLEVVNNGVAKGLAMLSECGFLPNDLLSKPELILSMSKLITKEVEEKLQRNLTNKMKA
jgi:hypothetical protein